MRIRVKVIPHAKQAGITPSQDPLTQEDIYVVKLTAKPVDGEANKMLINSLADYFGVAKRHIKILKGEKSRRKIIEIEA